MLLTQTKENIMNVHYRAMQGEAIMRDTISSVFAMPEREQPAKWVEVIEAAESVVAEAVGDSFGKSFMINAIKVYKSIAREAKYFA